MIQKIRKYKIGQFLVTITTKNYLKKKKYSGIILLRPKLFLMLTRIYIQACRASISQLARRTYQDLITTASKLRQKAIDNAKAELKIQQQSRNSANPPPEVQTTSQATDQEEIHPVQHLAPQNSVNSANPSHQSQTVAQPAPDPSSAEVPLAQKADRAYHDVANKLEIELIEDEFLKPEPISKVTPDPKLYFRGYKKPEYPNYG